MKKKLIAIILITALLLSMFGCAAQDAAEETAAPSDRPAANISPDVSASPQIIQPKNMHTNRYYWDTIDNGNRALLNIDDEILMELPEDSLWSWNFDTYISDDWIISVDWLK